MDAALIERAREGDRTALEHLLQEVAPLVRRYGLRMCRHEADAEDVLQDRPSRGRLRALHTRRSCATHLQGRSTACRTSTERCSSFATWRG